MPENRHFSKNKKFYVFSVFANFTRFYDSENGKKLIRLGHFYTARQRFVSILTKIRDCARRWLNIQFGGGIGIYRSQYYDVKPPGI